MKALVCILIASAWMPLSAQDSTRATADSAAPHATHPYRDPHRALIFGSLIPGAGHIYAGEYGRGFVNYESVVYPMGLGAMMFAMTGMCTTPIFSPDPCNPRPKWVTQVLGGVAVGAGLWRWVWTARDATHAAERANLRHSRKAAAVKPIIDAPVGPRDDWRVGVEIPW
jgi:hypothetical protein